MRTDLQEHIKFETNYTPLSWRKRYNLMKGSTHGLAHTLTQLGYLRPHNRHSRYHNLYFVGASTHPGTGLPSALISAHRPRSGSRSRAMTPVGGPKPSRNYRRFMRRPPAGANYASA